MGNIHPSTHGVLRIVSIIQGEVMVWLGIEIGYLHRGSEKLIESNYWSSSIPYLDRMDYVNSLSQELLFICIVERISQSYILMFTSVFRCLLVEYARVVNHTLAIVSNAIDIGIISTMLWIIEERDKMLMLLEFITGSRFHCSVIMVGRVRYDVSLGYISLIINWLLSFTRRFKSMHFMLSSNVLFISRMSNVISICRNTSLYYGLSGILFRSCYI